MEDNFLKVAKLAALEAGKVIQKYSGKDQHKNVKHEDPTDYATEADLEAEKIIVSHLSKNFPDHNIITEEQENIEKGSEYTWVIDPLDGTFSFFRGIPQFCVSIGLMRESMPILGVIYHVSGDDLIWASEGKGAYLNSKKIQVSELTSLKESAVYLDFGHYAKRMVKFELYIKVLLNKVGTVYSLGSATLGLSWVGKGIFDAYVIQAWLWDFVAGALIVREAGGRVTDFEGNEPDWTAERLNIVASNGLIHDQILEALK